MKQTSNYQFNLIESGDTFSPSPLNENAEKAEEILTGLEGELSSQIAAVMAAMGSGGSTARIAFGSWTGDGNYGASHKRTLSFGFKPVLVVVLSGYPEQLTHMVRSHTASSYGSTTTVEWGDRSVSFWCYNSADGAMAHDGRAYHYVAIGV